MIHKKGEGKMLLNFSVMNWRSIKDELNFSMRATRESQHGERLTRSKKFRFRVLPNAVLFGPNASGKSSFVSAIEFMRDFILNWDERFLNRELKSYKLDENLKNGASAFSIELFINDELYEYSFICSKKEVIEESLIRANSNSEYTLFHRKNDLIDIDESQFSKDNYNRLQVIFQGTDKTRLLLNNAHEQKFHGFDVVYNWFQDSLQIIHPSSYFSRLIMFKSEKIMQLYNVWLPHLDTGIKKIDKEKISAKDIGLSSDEINEILDNVYKLNDDQELDGHFFADDNFIMIDMPKGQDPEFYRLITVHKDEKGDPIHFKMADESDGTRRLLDLIPAFCTTFKKANTTYIIDEIDRSLHSQLTINLFKSFQHRCANGEKDQIIATTHDLELMTQKLFRRDEMWFFERQNDGTTITSFADFTDTRNDLDIRKSYLDDRLGGLPDLRFDLIDQEMQEISDGT